MSALTLHPKASVYSLPHMRLKVVGLVLLVSWASPARAWKAKVPTRSPANREDKLKSSSGRANDVLDGKTASPRGDGETSQSLRNLGQHNTNQPRKALANPPSPQVPAAFIELAKPRDIVAVSGANGATQMRHWITSGLGTKERPLGFDGKLSVDSAQIQTFEAAVAVLEQADPGRRVIYGWGFGDAVDPKQTYYYRAGNDQVYELHFLDRQSVATGASGLKNILHMNARSANRDAKVLTAALEDARSHGVLKAEIDPFVIGDSWSAGVVMLANKSGAFKFPAIAAAGPSYLPGRPNAPGPLSFLGWTNLQPNGSHGLVNVLRRPDDGVGKPFLGPLEGAFAGPGRPYTQHDYRLEFHFGERAERVAGGYWGISGSGLLVVADPAVSIR